ncbi:hypothetical protein JTB14_014174 [Gonioctena quinquepunctata]|nr:hypothetical protein JTB14_014174 [Gonioctena quinquepunctata]
MNIRGVGIVVLQVIKSKTVPRNNINSNLFLVSIKKSLRKNRINIPRMKSVHCIRMPDAPTELVHRFGASTHMTHHKKWLVNYTNQPKNGFEVFVANNQDLYSGGVGDDPFELKSYSRIDFWGNICSTSYFQSLISESTSLQR